VISFLVGAVFIVVGIVGIIWWFPDFLIVVRGLLPVSLVLGGAVAVMTGLAAMSVRRRSNAKKAD
jgi:hypothetical protein